MNRQFFHRFLLLLTIVLWGTGAQATQYYVGLKAGHNYGMGWQVFGQLENFAANFPFAARLEIGRSSLNPGSAEAARKIFINNATNGIPQKEGRLWNYRLDLLYPVNIKPLPNARLVGGMRYAKYLGNFKYVGGNEDFDVTSSQWGWGLGLESSFAINPKIALQLTGGLDYFKKSTLQGHDTAYSPNGDNVNPREDYTFSDADKAINQPGLELRLVVGFSYRL